MACVAAGQTLRAAYSAERNALIVAAAMSVHRGEMELVEALGLVGAL